MEWLIGIYLVIGVFKTLALFGNPNPAIKPVWMLREKNPLKLAIFFTLHVALWPLPRGGA